MLEDIRFDFFLDGIRELHSLVGKEFYAIVVIRIVRSGDDDADVKIILTNEASNAGSRKNSSKGDGSATVEKSGGDDAGDMRAGFACVGANEGVGRRMTPVKEFGNGAAKRKESAVIEGSGAGDATNAVRSKKLPRHKVKGR